MCPTLTVQLGQQHKVRVRGLQRNAKIPIYRSPALPHLADNAVLHVRLLAASLLAHQSDLQLAERLGQDVALCEELPPLHNVSL